MSDRIDAQVAIPAPPPARSRSREVERSRTIWLTEPIDLRQAVERLEVEDESPAGPSGLERDREEIARRLRDPQRAS